MFGFVVDALCLTYMVFGVAVLVFRVGFDFDLCIDYWLFCFGCLFMRLRLSDLFGFTVTLATGFLCVCCGLVGLFARLRVLCLMLPCSYWLIEWLALLGCVPLGFFNLGFGFAWSSGCLILFGGLVGLDLPLMVVFVCCFTMGLILAYCVV